MLQLSNQAEKLKVFLIVGSNKGIRERRVKSFWYFEGKIVI